MFGRKHIPRTAPSSRPVAAADDLRDAYLRVIRAFTDAGPVAAPPAYHPAPAPGGLTLPTPPPPVHAPGAAFTGALGDVGSSRRPDLTNLQMDSVMARVQTVIQELLGRSDIGHLTVEEAVAAEGKLDAMRARGALTEEQYAALKDGLGTLARSV